MRRGALHGSVNGPQPPLAVAPVRQVGVQEALEDAPVVGREQMDELVDDDEFAEVAGEGEQLAVEREAASIGADGSGGACVAEISMGDGTREGDLLGGHRADGDIRRTTAAASS